MRIPIAVIQKFLELGNLPSDTEEERLNKEHLMLMATHFTFVSVVWGTMFFVNGLLWVSVLPYSYTLISSISLLIFLKTKKFSFFKNTQLCLVLFLPFIIHLILGSFITSSVAILWSIVCPLAALFFISIRQALHWFMAYMILLLIGHLIDDALMIYDHSSISESFMDILFLMNIGGVSILVFLVQVYFSKSERDLKMQLMDANKELERQHESLSIEQGKTKQILRKVENLFGQQVSIEVARELISHEKDYDSKSYDVTILFLDIRNFSKFADANPPSVVAAFQNVIFSEVLDVVREHKGITNQIMGDGIMAVFGAPIKDKNHMVNAVKAGYALLDKIEELNQLQKIPQTRIGIGLHSGNVIAGNIGNDFRRQYSITGSTVNIAARIEQLNKEYSSQFLISERIKDRIQNLGLSINFVEDVRLKGIEKSLKIYKLR